ncbi:DJ-1/PfpI family protein [Liquorilactobacillus mali]|uniref:ThiJ PfpI domain-containing protein n=1 Tax=Liquorilactobacillus mali TaxID=1618 RepID=A0A0R2FXG3_9LACO|nr:DJ-1/PfpI family protein [Liquorilactobacillus mali]KRN33058.1 ThiJ PfpI domain-containing protein [Liquorilactobacillus mali]MDV7757612.1 DJ-1/PfpI family protein [Liquorilactobacillus mali]
MDINILLFNDFEPLDVFGPMEVFLHADGFRVNLFTLDKASSIKSYDQISLDAKSVSDINKEGVLLIPGGAATRTLISDTAFLKKLALLASKATYCLTVCTGSALLAATHFMDGKRATSNKLAFDWVTGSNTQVNWVKEARWIVDDRLYSSSGVSAGIDMSLAFLADTVNEEFADNIAHDIEYIRVKDNNNDPFS